MTINNPIAWFEIYVQDMHRAKAFYETVLQTTFTPMSDPTDSGMEMLEFFFFARGVWRSRRTGEDGGRTFWFLWHFGVLQMR